MSQPPERDPRFLLSLLASMTALVGALTSFYKATDKTLEQTSYEALASYIVELQRTQVELLERLERQAETSAAIEAPVAPAASPMYTLLPPVDVVAPAFLPTITLS